MDTQPYTQNNQIKYSQDCDQSKHIIYLLVNTVISKKIIVPFPAELLQKGAPQFIWRSKKTKNGNCLLFPDFLQKQKGKRERPFLLAKEERMKEGRG